MTIEMVGDLLKSHGVENFEILEMPGMVTRLVSGGLKVEGMLTTPKQTHLNSRKGCFRDMVQCHAISSLTRKQQVARGEPPIVAGCTIPIALHHEEGGSWD